MSHSKNFKDLTDQKYNRVTFLEFFDRTENGNSRWKVRCDCGTEFIAHATNVKRGNTRSCGCLRIEKLKARHKTK